MVLKLRMNIASPEFVEFPAGRREAEGIPRLKAVEYLPTRLNGIAGRLQSGVVDSLSYMC